MIDYLCEAKWSPDDCRIDDAPCGKNVTLTDFIHLYYTVTLHHCGCVTYTRHNSETLNIEVIRNCQQPIKINKPSG